MADPYLGATDGSYPKAKLILNVLTSKLSLIRIYSYTHIKKQNDQITRYLDKMVFVTRLWEAGGRRGVATLLGRLAARVGRGAALGRRDVRRRGIQGYTCD